jgi:polyhydroxybutyrate depolymerase
MSVHHQWIELSGGRGYLLRQPPGGADAGPRPAVLLLHGTGGTAAWAAEESRFGPFADRHGVIAVYPQALPPRPDEPPRFLANPPAWNAGTVIPGHKPADLPYFEELFADLSARVAIDPARVYATGFSNGAAMCFELAVRFADRLAAIAPVAGYCRAKVRPARPIPTLYVIGEADPMVPPAGGTVTSPWTGETLERPPALDELNRWAELIGCEPRRVLVGEADGVREERYPGPVEFIVKTVAELGHHWPGGRGQLKRTLAGLPSDRLDGNSAVWEFFARHRLPPG